MNGAVILAAGSSTRLGNGIKKEFLSYRGKPLLYHGVKAFLETGYFSTVLVTCRPDLLDETRSLLEDLDGLEFTTGGSSRQESVLNSLEYLEKKNLGTVLIHDGARPFISPETIKRVLETVKQRRACIPVEPTSNTMKMINEEGLIITHLAREFTRGAQTPQGFEFAPLLKAHRLLALSHREMTDDSEIWDLYEGPVATVDGNIENIKITYPSDLKSLGLDKGLHP